MNLDQLERDYERRKKSGKVTPSCDPCNPPTNSSPVKLDHVDMLFAGGNLPRMILVEVSPGVVEYQIMTEDGRLIPIDTWDY